MYNFFISLHFYNNSIRSLLLRITMPLLGDSAEEWKYNHRFVMYKLNPICTIFILFKLKFRIIFLPELKQSYFIEFLICYV